MKSFDVFALLCLGYINVVAGSFWIYKPAGLIVAGLLLIVFAVCLPFFLAIKK